MNPRSQNLVAILAIVAVLLIGIVAFAVYYNSPETIDNEEVACTQEAKLCPDGSYVGRSGPLCEFEACPTAEESDWKTASSSEASFEYPINLSTEYVKATDWPPKLELTDEEFSCTEGGEINERAGETKRETINGRQYCVTRISEGAAGSVYTQYAYAFAKEDQTAIFSFRARATQCANYDGDEKTDCEEDQRAFDPNTVVDRMAQSLKVASST